MPRPKGFKDSRKDPYARRNGKHYCIGAGYAEYAETEAAAQGISAAELIERLLFEHEHRHFTHEYAEALIAQTVEHDAAAVTEVDVSKCAPMDVFYAYCDKLGRPIERDSWQEVIEQYFEGCTPRYRAAMEIEQLEREMRAGLTGHQIIEILAEEHDEPVELFKPDFGSVRRLVNIEAAKKGLPKYSYSEVVRAIAGLFGKHCVSFHILKNRLEPAMVIGVKEIAWMEDRGTLGNLIANVLNEREMEAAARCMNAERENQSAK
jgi:hypothetical protein